MRSAAGQMRKTTTAEVRLESHAQQPVSPGKIRFIIYLEDADHSFEGYRRGC
jgi:hypothetical protein